MKRYYNAATHEYYTEGKCMTRKLSPNHIWSGKPTPEQLQEWGYEEISEPVIENVPYTPTYEELVDQKIRERYTFSNEFAILRQRFSKPEEFAEYNDFCELCKKEAKLQLGIEDETNE